MAGTGLLGSLRSLFIPLFTILGLRELYMLPLNPIFEFRPT
jgi:hypothetical protein